MEVTSDFHVIDDFELLKLIRESCYTNRDVRASWIGPGLPYTHREEYKNWALWATCHWAMYSGFLDLIDSQKELLLLDVGCGTGYCTRRLASIYSGSSIVGIDRDKESINFASSYNNASNIEYIPVDFLTWNEKDLKYDYIFALDVLEHIPSKFHFDFIDKCLSMLKKNGKLLLSTPNALKIKDSEFGHVGLLTKQRFLKFASRYSKNIVKGNFYNNEELGSLDLSKFIIDEPLEMFDRKDGKNRSHFRIVMQIKAVTVED
jgi:2-polyprenyl-3-methyl-5-hydroxy-6-metoxy-1,4-benzoquinol methylase